MCRCVEVCMLELKEREKCWQVGCAPVHQALKTLWMKQGMTNNGWQHQSHLFADDFNAHMLLFPFVRFSMLFEDSLTDWGLIILDDLSDFPVQSLEGCQIEMGFFSPPPYVG